MRYSSNIVKHPLMSRTVFAGCLFFLVLIFCGLSGLGATTASAAEHESWSSLARHMNAILDQSSQKYHSGDAEGGKKKVNEAYYQNYETSGFEKQVMARISGNRVAQVEMQFKLIKKSMNESNGQEVDQRILEIKAMLTEDASILDGTQNGNDGEQGNSPWLSSFLPAFVVILREGLEAILVVSAIIAYLVKSGRSDKTKTVWLGVGIALVASVALAVLFSQVSSILAKQNQEIFEGVTALFAVVMLIWVSNWMLSRASEQSWEKYIKTTTEQSLSRSSLFSLAFIAFLAVFREGAETILFYSPIVSASEGSVAYVWVGLGLGIIVLVIIFMLFKYLAIKIPLKLFFSATSAFLALMAVIFTGKGIKELQEGDLLQATIAPGVPTIDVLGIYPTAESIGAQILVIVIIAGLYLYGYRNQKRRAVDKQSSS